MIFSISFKFLDFDDDTKFIYKLFFLSGFKQKTISCYDVCEREREKEGERDGKKEGESVIGRKREVERDREKDYDQNGIGLLEYRHSKK